MQPEITRRTKPGRANSWLGPKTAPRVDPTGHRLYPYTILLGPKWRPALARLAPLLLRPDIDRDAATTARLQAAAQQQLPLGMARHWPGQAASD